MTIKKSFKVPEIDLPLNRIVFCTSRIKSLHNLRTNLFFFWFLIPYGLGTWEVPQNVLKLWISGISFVWFYYSIWIIYFFSAGNWFLTNKSCFTAKKDPWSQVLNPELWFFQSSKHSKIWKRQQIGCEVKSLHQH